MKKTIFGFLFFACVKAHAAPPVAEAPIQAVGTGTTVSVSTSAWTAVPTSSSLSRRHGIKVSNPSSNSANAVCVLSSSSSSPSEATTVRPIEIQPGENPFVPARADIYLYCLSLNSSAESVHVQEVGQ